ncbi:PIN domain-containing protein [Maribacter stanieri]|uniref:PIN domain-containing protein n=1 Tax=Maribacter stanieri TaxID=440514 RepID=UPI002495A65E|nr:PIN domain-containing protein [Maribacter stanieri]
MKKEFSEHFSPTEKEIKAIWEKAIFIFDTNILLNFYRYSEETKDRFIEIIEELSPRVFFVNHTINEYLKNRISEIQTQKELYSSAIKNIDKLESLFDYERQHPFLPNALLEEMKEVNQKVKDDLKKSKDFQEKRLTEDDIRNDLIKITKGRVGEPYSEEKLFEIYEEGAKRYKKKLPPGYMDSDKLGAGDGSAFGDLIIWKQIIDFSLSKKRDIIFITEDKKEDWWLISKGKTIGPRPELLKEFLNLTKQRIQIYQPSLFLKLVGDFLESNVEENIVKEVQESNVSYIEKNEGLKRIKYSRDKAFSNYLQRRMDENIRKRILFDRHLEEIGNKKKELEVQLLDMELDENFDKENDHVHLNNYIKVESEMNKLLYDEAKLLAEMKRFES